MIKRVRGRYWAAYVFFGVIVGSIVASLLNDSLVWRSVLIALVIGTAGLIAFYLMYRKTGGW